MQDKQGGFVIVEGGRFLVDEILIINVESIWMGYKAGGLVMWG